MLAAIAVVFVPPQCEPFIVSRDITINEFYPTWRLVIDDLTIATGEKGFYCIRYNFQGFPRQI